MTPTLLLHSMATPELDAGGCVSAAVQLGLDGIELIVDDDYSSALSPTSAPRVIDALGERARGEGIVIGAVSSYARDIGGPDQRLHRDAVALLQRAIEIAQRVSAPGVRVLVGRRELDGVEWDAAASGFAAGLQSLLDEAAAAGVRLELENHMDTLASSGRRTADLAALLDHQATSVIYDPANLALMAAEPPAEAIHLQRPWLTRVHVKNFVGGAEARHPVDLEAGVVSWPAVISALADLTVPVESMTFEYERRWYDLPPAVVALPSQIALLRTLLRAEEGAGS